MVEICSVGVCRHLYLCAHASLSAQVRGVECLHSRVRLCMCVCVCMRVLGAACERRDLGGKSWSRKLLEVILWPTADNGFPPGAS